MGDAAAWLLLGLALVQVPDEASAGAPGPSTTPGAPEAAPDDEPTLGEGDTCILAAPLRQRLGAESEVELAAGTRVRVVRPDGERTWILAADRLGAVSSTALDDACRRDHGSAETVLDDPAEALRQAEATYDGLRFAEVLPLTRGVLAHPATTPEQRLRAYLLQGSALAIMGYTVEAETAFRSLLRVDPEFSLDERTTPRVLSVFDRVAREEEVLRGEEAALRRREMLAELKLTLEEFDGLRGGQPLVFDVAIRDPRGVVDEARAYYRRAGEGDAFASIALSQLPSGRWQGELPAAFTVSDRGFELEYFVVTLDDGGEPLLSLGEAEVPRRARILPGQVPGPPVYQTAWFWGVVGGSAAAVSVLAAVAAGTAGVTLYSASRVPGQNVFNLD